MFINAKKKKKLPLQSMYLCLNKSIITKKQFINAINKIIINNTKLKQNNQFINAINNNNNNKKKLPSTSKYISMLKQEHNNKLKTTKLGIKQKAPFRTEEKVRTEENIPISLA
jgi:hypothetical protein